MPKLIIIYDSRTGNTEKMARAIAEGAESVEGVAVVLKFHVKPEELADVDAMRNRFEMETIEPGLRMRYAPDEKGLEECRKLGKAIGKRS